MRSDNPVAAGVLMGLGSFLTGFVQMRMTLMQFNLDVEKFEEAKAQNADENEINRRRIMMEERGLELREDELALRAQMPWLEIAAKQDAFATDLANEVTAEQTLGKVTQGFEETKATNEHRRKKEFEEYQNVTIPLMQQEAGLPVRGVGTSGGSDLDALHPVTGIPYRTHNRAVDAAGKFISDLADENDSFNSRLKRRPDGSVDYSQLPPEAQDMWGRSFLLALQAEDFDEARIVEFFQRRGISTSVLTQFGIDPASPRTRIGQKPRAREQTQREPDRQAPGVKTVQETKFGKQVSGEIKGETRGQAAARMKKDLDRLYPQTAPKTKDPKGIKELQKMFREPPKAEQLP